MQINYCIGLRDVLYIDCGLHIADLANGVILPHTGLTHMPSKRTIKLSASTKPVSTPLAAASTAQQAAGRSNVAKPVTVAANVVSAIPAVAKPKAEPVDTSPRGLTRDAAGVTAQRTNYDTYSDRDSAYLRFFGAVCRANGGKATLAQIHAAGVTRADALDRKRFNPHYLGSAKATDVGAINRQIKSGHFTKAPDGSSIVPTKLAIESKLYNGKA